MGLHTHVAPEKLHEAFINNDDNKYTRVVIVFTVKNRAGSFFPSLL